MVLSQTLFGKLMVLEGPTKPPFSASGCKHRAKYNVESGSKCTAAADSLIIEVLPLAVDLVLQGEVKGDVLHLLLDKDLGARGVLLFLQVFDHVGEPHGQTIVAAGEEEVEAKEEEEGEQQEE